MRLGIEDKKLGIAFTFSSTCSSKEGKLGFISVKTLVVTSCLEYKASNLASRGADDYEEEDMPNITDSVD